LIIDDDPTVHQLIKNQLSYLNVSIYSAFNGQEGIELADQILPKVIILDVQMPSMSGWEVLKSLKLQSLTSGIPIILLTTDDENTERYEIGANDYLFKPIDRDRLISKIEKYRSGDSDFSVLVIEDDWNVRSMLRRMLEKENCLVSEAADGYEALKVISDNQPQLILLDLTMPNVDGFEFIHLLRLTQGITSIPIIIITAKDLTEADTVRLSGSVQKIVQKSNFSSPQLFAEIGKRLQDLGIS